MGDEEDILRVVSDFIKGKLGPPDAGLATLSFKGDINPEDIPMPKMSSVYRDFISEYSTVRKAMNKYSLGHCLKFIGAMLTLPEFQSNSYRLKILASMAFLCAKGKSRPTSAHATAWFNQMNEGTCGRQEDPAEDVFVSHVSFQSVNYRIFEGAAEGNSFHTQLVLDILSDMPEAGRYLDLKKAVTNLLKLSDEVVSRSGLAAYSVGNQTPAAKIKKPDKSIWSELGKRVAFSLDELSDLGIDPNGLRPFCLAPPDIKTLETQSPGQSVLEAKPILPTKDGLVLFLPSEVGFAIRDCLIRSCFQSGEQHMLHRALGNAYSALFSNEILFGTSTLKLDMERYAEFLAAQAVIEIDAGRFLHLIFVVDSFDGYEDDAFLGTPDIDKLTDLVSRSVDQVYSDIAAKDGFREGLTIVIGCGWGRGFGFRLGEPRDNWRVEMMPAFDAVTLSRLSKFETLDLFRMLDALDALEAMGIHLANASGLLNLYAWTRSNNGHLVPHEQLDDDFVGEPGSGNLAIPTNCNLSVRYEARVGADIRTLPRPDGSIAMLRRAHGTPRYGTDELVPFYVDLEALSQQTYRSVYEGENGIYWIEANTHPALDQNIRYELSKMIMHWGEVTFKFLDERNLMANVPHLSAVVKFQEIALPDASEPIMAAEDIPSFIEAACTQDDEGLHVQIEIKEGFLNSTRRSDNLGERGIVSALVTACLGMSSDQLDQSAVVSAVSAIVRSDSARHFHAFSQPQLRDYVRHDLPESAQVIAKMDDTSGRLGLGWICRERSAGGHILGLADCNAYLRELVDALVANLLDRLSKFDRGSLVELMLRNHEAAMSELDTWKRTYGAIEALSDEASLAAGTAVERMGRLNAASMTSRIVIEAGVCVCPIESGLVPGRYDMGQLMALAALIHHMGGYSEAMTAGVMPAEIKISPAGDVMMQHEFSDSIIQPFGKSFQTKALRDAASSYIEHYTSQEGGQRSADQIEELESKEKEFEAVWAEEYGFSLDDLGEFVGFFHVILQSDCTAVIRMKHTELVSSLRSETKMTEDSIETCLNLFTYGPRQVWNASPEGFANFAWFPWRFQRQLSIVSRPIVQVTNEGEIEYLVAPAMVVSHIAKFVTDARTGAFDRKFFRKDGPMIAWAGSIRGEEGEAFNHQVASEFERIGWDAKPNLSDGQILSRKKDPRFGDVDVLAWNKELGTVLIVECKDLSFDKTIGEVAWRLAKYQGEVKPDGKRDDLRRHLDRCQYIDDNLAQLSEFVGFQVSKTERILLLSNSTPLQFSKSMEKHDVRVVTFEEIEGEFGTD